jgi:hypothetical protein
MNPPQADPHTNENISPTGTGSSKLTWKILQEEIFIL